MSLGITISDAAFDADCIIGSYFPRPDILIGLYQHGGTLADSIKNQFNAAAPATAVGAPIISATSASCNNGGCFNSQHIPGASMSFAAVMKIPATSSALVGNYQNAVTPVGDALAVAYSSGVPQLRVYASLASGVSSNAQYSLAGLDTGIFRVVAGTIDGTGLTASVYLIDDDGDLLAYTATLSSHSSAARAIRLGSAYDTAVLTGSKDIAASAIWDGVLSISDIADLRAYWQNVYGSTLGNAL